MLIPFCVDVDGVLPCIESSAITFHGNQTPKWTQDEVILMDALDPRHQK